MSRKKRYIEKLTKEEKISLEKGYRIGKSHVFRRKCQCILLSNTGSSVEELAILYQVRTRTIYDWFNRWEQEGLEGLKLKPGRGRPTKLSAENAKQVKVVKQLIENEPKNLNRVVAQVETELAIELSKKTLIRFLKNLNTHGNDLGNG